MRSTHRLLSVVFFLFLFSVCDPAIPTLAEKYIPCQKALETENTQIHAQNVRITFVPVTAYSSTPDQTDDSPFTTASGTCPHDGIAAANFLPFGTKFMLPEIFGEKIFTVEDRMSERFSKRIDIWMGTREKAMRFGIRELAIIIL